jgi:competence protein ComEA
MTVGIRRAGLLLVTVLLTGLLFAGALAATKTPPPPHSVNLNTATLHDLTTLPGIGPTRAEAILDFRRKNGQFRSVNDLLVIHGISKKRLELIRPYITVSSPLPHSQAVKPKPVPPKPSSPKSASPTPSSKLSPKTNSPPAQSSPPASQPATTAPVTNPGV